MGEFQLFHNGGSISASGSTVPYLAKFSHFTVIHIMTSAGQNEIQLLSVASSWPIEAHCCQHCSDTILSHPHASDRQGGRNYKLQTHRLRAPWTNAYTKWLKQNAEGNCVEVKTCTYAIIYQTQRNIVHSNKHSSYITEPNSIQSWMHSTCSSFH